VYFPLLLVPQFGILQRVQLVGVDLMECVCVQDHLDVYVHYEHCLLQVRLRVIVARLKVLELLFGIEHQGVRD